MDGSTLKKLFWKIRIIAEVTLFAFILNWLWEYAQCSTFIHLNAPATHQEMFLASLGDVLLTWISIGSMGLISRSPFWFLERWSWIRLALLTLFNLTLGGCIEWIALKNGRWAYTSSNPVISSLNISILPLLQLCLLIPFSLWLARIRSQRL